MSGITSTGNSIAQILARNSQTSSTDQSKTNSTSESSNFSLASQQTNSSSTSAKSELTSQSESLAGQLSDSIMSILMELQEVSAIDDVNSSFDAQQLFSDMDADDDGTLTKEEFMAGAPDDVTEEMSEDLWNIMAGSDAESISEDEFLGAMPQSSNEMSTADQSANSTSAQSEEENYDPLDTNEDGIVSLAEMTAAVQADTTSSPSNQLDVSSDISDEAETNIETYSRSALSENDATEQVSSGGFDPRNESFNNRLMAQVMS